jgi:hypothetical protein
MEDGGRNETSDLSMLRLLACREGSGMKNREIYNRYESATSDGRILFSFYEA